MPSTLRAPSIPPLDVRKKMMKYSSMIVLIGVLPIALLNSCSTIPETQDHEVRLIEDKERYKYKYIATVTSHAEFSESVELETDNALKKVKKEAAELGANAIDVVYLSTGLNGTTIKAEALKINFLREKQNIFLTRQWCGMPSGSATQHPTL